MYKIEFTKQAKTDAKIARSNGFKDKVDEINTVIQRDPFEKTSGHHYEELKDNLKGIHTRRLNRHNRFVYEILSNTEELRSDENGELYDGIVSVLSMWGHPY